MIAFFHCRHSSRLGTAVAAAVSAATPTSLDDPFHIWTRYASSDRGGGGGGKKSSSGFRPGRRSNQNYRPVVLKKPKKKVEWSPVQLGKVKNPRDELDATFGPMAADVIRETRRERAIREAGLVDEDPFEKELRVANYFTAETGSMEDLVAERRALASQFPDAEDRREFMKNLESIVERKQNKLIGLEREDESDDEAEDFDGDDADDPDERDPETHLDHNQLAHGDWSEQLITVKRNIKLWRGGRLEGYRALVIGGNMNGCIGYGIGKSKDPMRAVDNAGRITKRNIYFIDRYQNDGLTRDLVGKQNSCIVTIRATDNGLRGNPLVTEILMRAGITNAVSKAHGNRTPFNVVRATFKALMTHESLEEIALKRGKRLVSIDRAMRMQI